MLRACPHSSTHSGKHCPLGRGGKAGRNLTVWGLIQGKQKFQALGIVLPITSPATGRLEQLHEESDHCGCRTPCSDRHSHGKPEGSLVATLLSPFLPIRGNVKEKKPGETYSERLPLVMFVGALQEQV